MNFSEFAKTLHRIHKGSIDDFTKCLLQGGLPEDGVAYIEELKPDTFRAYYHGKRLLTKLYENALFAWDKDLFISHIEMEFEQKSYKEICQQFDEKGIKIDPAKVPSQLADIFADILDEVKKGTMLKQPQSPPEDEQTVLRMLDHDRESLAILIEKLDESLEHVQDPLHDYLFTWLYLNEKERKEYEESIDAHIFKIIEYCKKLEFYAKRYPDFSELKKLCTLGMDIHLEYYAVKDREALAEYEAYLQELHETLDQVSAKLVDY